MDNINKINIYEASLEKYVKEKYMNTKSHNYSVLFVGINNLI